MSEIVDNLQKILHKRFKNAPNIICGSELPPTQFISTGILSLDWAWGGGLPLGHMIVLVGGEKSGKSTTCLKLVSELQKAGRRVQYIDIERVLDYDWAKLHKVDLANLAIYNVAIDDSAEYVLDVATETLLAGYDVVMDSVAFLESAQSMEKQEKAGYSGKTYGGISGPLTMFCKNVGKIIGDKGNSLIVVNQYRDNMTQYGSRSRIPGGRALRYAASIMTEFSKGDFITGQSDEDKIGIKVKFYTTTNRVGNPFRGKSYDLYFNVGVNPLTEVIEMGKHYDLLEVKAGGWMSYEGHNMGQGPNQHMIYLANNPEIYKHLYGSILKLIKEGKR